MAKDVVVPEVDERTRNQVIRYLGTKTVRQIAEAVGVSPEVVLRVKQDIVDSLDALTVEEYVAKAFVDLQTITTRAMEKFESVEDERALSGLLNNATNAITRTLQMLEKWDSKNKGKIEVINQKRQAELITALNRMSEITAETLDDGEPHSKDEILQTMLNALMTAAVEMEARNSE